MVRNARIASDHIELDVLVNDEREVRLVERLGLNLQEVRVIDMERTINYDVHDALFKYVELFNKERFWEARLKTSGDSRHRYGTYHKLRRARCAV